VSAHPRHSATSGANAGHADYLPKEDYMPALSISLLLIAVGAIMAFAVTTAVEGVAIVTIGWILMIVGALGLLMALLFMMSFSPFGTTRDTHDAPTTHTH
jgi:hypothetical protein